MVSKQGGSGARQHSGRASTVSETVLSVAERVLEDLVPNTSQTKRAIVAKRIVRQADRDGLRKAQDRRKLIVRLAPMLARTRGGLVSGTARVTASKNPRRIAARGTAVISRARTAAKGSDSSPRVDTE